MHIYPVQGGQPSQQVSLGLECEQEGIAEALVFSGGVVAMSPLRHLWWEILKAIT